MSAKRVLLTCGLCGEHELPISALTLTTLCGITRVEWHCLTCATDISVSLTTMDIAALHHAGVRYRAVTLVALPPLTLDDAIKFGRALAALEDAAGVISKECAA